MFDCSNVFAVNLVFWTELRNDPSAMVLSPIQLREFGDALHIGDSTLVYKRVVPKRFQIGVQLVWDSRELESWLTRLNAVAAACAGSGRAVFLLGVVVPRRDCAGPQESLIAAQASPPREKARPPGGNASSRPFGLLDGFPLNQALVFRVDAPREL